MSEKTARSWKVYVDNLGVHLAVFETRDGTGPAITHTTFGWLVDAELYAECILEAVASARMAARAAVEMEVTE